MKTNQEYKNHALSALKGNWAPAVAGAIIFIICTVIIAGPGWISNMYSFGQLRELSLSPAMLQVLSYASLPLSVFLLYPLTLGYTVAHNRLIADSDTDITGNTFRSTFSGYFRNVWAMFLVNFFIFLWSLLLIIPGIIKSFSYAMTPYILKDYPELSANQAINLSMKMMKGHKFDYFYLMLSFIGWMFLCLFTLTIGYAWLMPYIYTSLASFYQDIRKDYIERTNL